MKEEKIKEILLKENYFILNKKIIKKLGVEMAYLLANFIEASDMISNDEGWFFQTYKIVEDLTGFKRKKQYNYIKELVRLGIILRKNMGIPRRRYFKINVEKIKEILYSDLEVKSLKEMIELEEEWLENSVFEEEDIEKEKPKKKFLKDKKVLLDDREEGEKENREEILKGKEISKEEKEILEKEENLKEEGSLKNDLPENEKEIYREKAEGTNDKKDCIEEKERIKEKSKKDYFQETSNISKKSKEESTQGTDSIYQGTTKDCIEEKERIKVTSSVSKKVKAECTQGTDSMSERDDKDCSKRTTSLYQENKRVCPQGANCIVPVVQTYKEININNKDKEINIKIDRSEKDFESKKEYSAKASSIDQKFKNNIFSLKEIIANSTMTPMNIIDNSIYNILPTLRKYDLELLISKIKESDFLMGKSGSKPSVANFTRKNMIDRIMADEYKNKDYSKKEEKIDYGRIEREIDPRTAELYRMLDLN